MKPVEHPKRQVALRFAGYAFAVFSVITIATILVFILLGYRFSESQGKFLQGGLVQFLSEPSGARITIGTAELGRFTRTKITVLPGDYLVKMEKDDYQTWQKNITVNAGEVLWLSSARLIPRNPESSVITQYDTLSSTAADASSSKYALMQDATVPDIKVYDLDSSKPKSQTLTIPTSAYTAAKKHTFTLLDWSPNGAYVALKHGFSGKSEIVLLDISDPKESVVLPGSKNVSVSDYAFDPDDGNQIYIKFSNNTLSKYALNNVESPTQVATNVDGFEVYEKGVLYVRSNQSGKNVLYAPSSGDTPQLIKSFKTTDPVDATIGEYRGGIYMIISSKKSTNVYKVDDITNADPKLPVGLKLYQKIRTDFLPTSIFTKNSGRFLFMIKGQSVVLYDFELDEEIRYTIPDMPNSTDIEEQWVDKFHYWIIQDKRLVLYEYDGSNVNDITTGRFGTDAVLSNDGKYLNTISSGPQPSLQRTTLKL